MKFFSEKKSFERLNFTLKKRPQNCFESYKFMLFQRFQRILLIYKKIKNIIKLVKINFYKILRVYNADKLKMEMHS